MTHILGQKLEMMKFSEEGTSKAETGWKLGLSPQTTNQGMNAEEKLLKKIKRTTPVNKKMIRKQNSLTANMKNVWVPWMEDQTRSSHRGTVVNESD